VLGVAGWVVVGIGQTASPPARGAQPARAQPPTTTQPVRRAQGPTTPVVPAGTGSQSRLPLEPLGIRGEAIWPAFEGWGPDKKDGTNLIVIGYNNRNNDMDMDIPIGPNNRMEPGGPDLGQPTHFMTGRKWGVFAIPVSKDFGTKKYTWTLIANGKTSVVQFWMNPPYWVDYYLHGATLNEPPVIWFAQDGPKFTGPPRGAALTLTAKVNEAVPLTLWATDEASKTVFDPNPPARGRGRGTGTDSGAAAGTAGGTDAAAPAGGRGGRGRGGRGAAPDAAAGADSGAGAPAGGRGRGAPPILFDLGGAPGGGGRGGGGGFGRGTGPQPDVVVLWTKYRGPGWVSIDDERLELFKKGDPKAVMQATTEAWFFEPGEYWLRAQVNDASGDGGGGDQCCWTNALVKVVVR
jgi:hypothetical protein